MLIAAGFCSSGHRSHSSLIQSAPFHSPPSRANECKGTKEEFVQLMKKSLMAEQLFAEGVGPSQKIDDIPIAGVQAAWHTRKKT